ncbi:unnamed protein product [Sphenostylis stenocarpa]|uniref:Uncharacterized protein n=1 Tax=Sphenostylis stenocarpa TaxID=92480 RepID=A0AA86SDP4_9FABA|nr:unnamed protein product [Sphenostylis stenocarpa]
MEKRVQWLFKNKELEPELLHQEIIAGSEGHWQQAKVLRWQDSGEMIDWVDRHVITMNIKEGKVSVKRVAKGAITNAECVVIFE